MALQDLANGNGFTLIDPLGDLAERLISRVPNWRQDDVIYLNAADRRLTWGDRSYTKQSRRLSRRSDA
jgi:hypothetical protein